MKPYYLPKFKKYLPKFVAKPVKILIIIAHV